MDNSYVNKRIGLSLAGGAARGFAHLGILDYLNQRKYHFSELSGCSFGAIVAALDGLGWSTKDILHLAQGFSFKKLLKWTWPKMGLSQTTYLKEFIKDVFQQTTFDDCLKKVVIVAVDIDSGQAYAFREGELWRAVAASICIPVLFEPFEHQGKRLVDGGLLYLNPTSFFEDVEGIIGTELGLARERLGPVRGISDYARQTIELLAKRQRQINDTLADVMIRPKVLTWPFLSFTDPQTLVDRGYQGCEEKEQEIYQLFTS